MQKMTWKKWSAMVADVCGYGRSDVEIILRAQNFLLNMENDPDCELSNEVNNLYDGWYERGDPKKPRALDICQGFSLFDCDDEIYVDTCASAKVTSYLDARKAGSWFFKWANWKQRKEQNDAIVHEWKRGSDSADELPGSGTPKRGNKHGGVGRRVPQGSALP